MPKIPNTLVLLAITIAVLSFIGYLWYRKFTGGATEVNGKPLVEPSEYVNLLVGLISLAVAVVFGLVATNLSNKANKYSEAALALANKQDSLHEELNELRNLASGQQKQLNELLRIVVRLDTQNQLSVSQIDELKLVTSNLGQQTGELRSLNKKQVEVSETISKQFAINSGILQYMLEQETKKFYKAHKELNHGVSELLKIYNSNTYNYRDLTMDSLDIINDLPFHRLHVINICDELLLTMQKYGGNPILIDYPRVSSSWGGTYWTIKKMIESLKEVDSHSNSSENQEKTVKLFNEFAFWGYSIFDDLPATIRSLYEERFQIDEQFIETLIPSKPPKKPN